VNAFVYDALVILGVTVMTLGLIGMIRMPDIYTKSHGASKSVFLGVMVLAISGMVVGGTATNGRMVLICLALLITTPVSSHVIGRAAFVRHEVMDHPGSVDETGSLRPHGDHPEWRL
jgi:monovalent cation/proton antiporter MnhG/PhaG subunit